MNELEAKIAQNKTDQERIAEEGRKLQQELAESQKPKLRHGDYGYAEKKTKGNECLTRDVVGRLVLNDPDHPGELTVAGCDTCRAPGKPTIMYC